ncbi:MAG: asparagine--tRNA ligase [bacterium]
MKQSVRKLLSSYKELDGKQIKLFGWVRGNRDQKEFGFINLNDGTAFEVVQVVYDNKLSNFSNITKIRVGSSVLVEGTIKVTPDAKQPFEILATNVELLGDSPEDYPIQPKRHTREFLREVAHLRPRTNLFSAVFRVRSVAAYAIHKFFQDQDFIYVHSPLITANDGEGAGETFKITTLDLDKLPRNEEKEIDYKKDFFGKEANLTVTGQLEAELFAMAFRDVYTFGPTFRAENSNTTRHASEFWMIEPEIAFADLNENMELIESMIKYIIKYVLEHCPSEMQFFDGFVEKGLLNRLNSVLNSNFKQVTHKDAIDILINSKQKFDNLPKHGEDLATEHEKYLTEVHFKCPVFVTNWPEGIKAFYMRLNDDKETVAAVDLLVPGAGELVGGSQREERLDVLLERMKQFNVCPEEMSWYLDTRRYGGCVHSGFGMGFERMIMYLTGVENIRDVIPFPRTPKNCEF